MATLHGTSKTPTVLVVGGGFGGLTVSRGLRRAPVDVLLVDRVNHHLFQPLLYQVASAVLSPAEIAQPIRRVLRHSSNTRVALAEVTAVDLDARQVEVGGVRVGYDFLVLAAGATHSYFGHDAWAEHAPGLKSIDDALEIRRRMLLAFEAAELEADPHARRARLTFVVVGGGPTGVELAGALKEIAVESLRADFRTVDTGTARVVLIEAQGRLLPGMSARASARALRDLTRMGVEVRLGTRVTHVTGDGVELQGERVDAASVFWAAGVQASPLGRTLGVELDSAGRVVVGPDCSLRGHPEVFVLGDMALLVEAERGRPVPGVAQGALQMGAHVARIIAAEVRGRGAAERPAFRYRDKGNMATIGRARAVADVWGTSFGGLFAWLLWSFVHVLFLIGFKNRVFVMLSWVYSYVVNAKGARLITGRHAIELQRACFSSIPPEEVIPTGPSRPADKEELGPA